MPQAQATPPTEEKSGATAVPQVVKTFHDRFGDPKNFINRELSWLAFNQRVLEEAQDPTQPLIERIKFLTIVSSNLDEFFEIRVAGIKQQIESETSDVGPDGLSATELFDRIQKTVRELVGTQYALWKNELLPELAKNGIYVLSVTERTREVGTRLAIGALEREVLMQFLVEAVVLSSSGGLFGILLGLGASLALKNMLMVPFVFDPTIVIIAFIFSAAVGVVFGYFPALKAARLDPIDALRHE